MENDDDVQRQFKVNDALSGAATISICHILNKILSHLDTSSRRPIIPLGHGDPSAFPCFRTMEVTEEAFMEVVRSTNYNCYAPTVGLTPVRSAITEYIPHNLPYKLAKEESIIVLPESVVDLNILAPAARF